MDSKPIVFDEWETVLKQMVAPELQRGYREAIVKFRYWLKQTGKTPDVETFKTHLKWKKSYLAAEKFEIRREALRWYYKEGLRNMNDSEIANSRGAMSDDTETDTRDKKTPQAASVKEGQEVPGYRTYHMTDVPTAGACSKKRWSKLLKL